jgi:hypothetical protein
MPKINWKEYNEKLVKRGEILFSTEFIENWKKELNSMNEKKRGHPYEYPNSYMQFLISIRYYCHLDYRTLEGFCRNLSRILGIPVPDHSTIHKRFLKMDFNPPALNSEEIVIAVDSTGIKVYNRGEWMREKYRKRRGWIKIHFAVDVETKQVIAYEVTDEQIHDNGKFKDLVEKSEERARVKRVLADKAYDSYDNFEFLQSRNIGPAIPVRKGAIDVLKHPRSEEARKQRDFDRWKKEKEYGLRWMVETAYSVFKRYFGEFVSTKKWDYMLREIAAKVWIYNSLRAILC